MVSYLLLLGGFLFLFLAVLAWKKIRNSGENFQFVYHWAFWFGAFVWEDVFVYSLYYAGTFFLTWLFHDVRLALVMISIFWIVRSGGEAVYFFLQQFHMPQHHPHAITTHLEAFRSIFGNIDTQKGYILLQILHQTIVMLAATTLVIIVLNWEHIPRWW